MTNAELLDWAYGNCARLPSYKTLFSFPSVHMYALFKKPYPFGVEKSPMGVFMTPEAVVDEIKKQPQISNPDNGIDYTCYGISSDNKMFFLFEVAW